MAFEIAETSERPGRAPGSVRPSSAYGLSYSACGGRETRETEDPADRLIWMARDDERANDCKRQEADPGEWSAELARDERVAGARDDHAREQNTPDGEGVASPRDERRAPRKGIVLAPPIPTRLCQTPWLTEVTTIEPDLRRMSAQLRCRGPAPEAAPAAIEILLREEVQRIEGAADSDRDKPIVRLLADTGVRVGELVTLKVGDVVDQERAPTFGSPVAARAVARKGTGSDLCRCRRSSRGGCAGTLPAPGARMRQVTACSCRAGDPPTGPTNKLI